LPGRHRPSCSKPPFETTRVACLERYRLDVALTTQHETVDRKECLMKSKRQTTKAKLARERLVQERRTLKREKKQAAAAARDEPAAAHDVHTLDDTAAVETNG